MSYTIPRGVYTEGGATITAHARDARSVRLTVAPRSGRRFRSDNPGLPHGGRRYGLRAVVDVFTDEVHVEAHDAATGDPAPPPAALVLSDLAARLAARFVTEHPAALAQKAATLAARAAM